jgi:DNA helicase II / ATP-dependent DNA helicase PcrA
LIAARVRRIYGYEEARWPSRFLTELPDEIVGGVGGHGGNARASTPAARNPPPRSPRTISRGGDEIVYDSDSLPHSDTDAYGDVYEEGGVFRRGSRVVHDRFGAGTVEDVDGIGRMARLTVRFETEGIRRVVASFVRSLD